MSEVRQRIADRLMEEVLGKVLGELLPSLIPDDQLWEALAIPDQEITKALGAFERGEIAYPELQGIATAYLGAWEGQAERLAGSGSVLVSRAT